MSVDFANVTAVTIPQGDVTKITDSSGDILWEKRINPGLFYYIQLHENTTITSNISSPLYTSFFYHSGRGNFSSLNTDIDSLAGVYTDIINPPPSSLKPIRTADMLDGGRGFTAYYVNDVEYKGSNNPTSILSYYLTNGYSPVKLDDAKWNLSDFWIFPVHDGRDATNNAGLFNMTADEIIQSQISLAIKFSKSQNPFSLTNTSGATTNIKYPFMEAQVRKYLTLYDNKSSDSRYIPVGSTINGGMDYLHVLFVLYYTSKTLETLIGRYSSNKQTNTSSVEYNIPYYSPRLKCHVVLSRL